MWEFDDLDDAEQANGVSAESDEERQRRQEAAAFKFDLDIEDLATFRYAMRQGVTALDGTKGVLILVQVVKQGASMFFVDAFNALYKRFFGVVQHRGKQGLYEDLRLKVVGVVLMHICHEYFRDPAKIHFQKIVDLLDGLPTVMAELLDKACNSSKVRRLGREVDGIYKAVVVSLREIMSHTASDVPPEVYKFIEEMAECCCSANRSEDGIEFLAPQFAEVHQYTTKFKIMKVTAVSACQILYELREQFKNSEFQAQYQELRSEAKIGNAAHTKIVNLAWSVQSDILPKYGYDSSSKGLNEMREDVGAYAGDSLFDFMPSGPFDAAVWKMRRDIHTILDLGRRLPSMPCVRRLDPVRFNPADKDKWLRHLALEGFVVLAGVVNEEEVRVAYNHLWDFIEASDTSGMISRMDLSTWHDTSEESTGWPAGKQDGIIHRGGIGQSRALWYLRCLPAVRQVYADIWGTDKLVTSFDGAGVFRPYGHSADWKIQKTNQGWCHVDQAHKKHGLHCVQGLVTLKDATDKTGGLVVVPGSHRFFEDHILKTYRHTDWHFIDMRANDPVLTENGGGPRVLCAKAGDMLLWDSRTIHCNSLPLVEDQDVLNSRDLIRAVAYICMTPAAWCSPESADKRLKAFQRSVTTTHWPHEYHSMGATEQPPNHPLTPEIRDLIFPHKGQPGSNIKVDASAPEPGRVSLLPEEVYVTRTQDAGRELALGIIPVRSVPTFDFGDDVGCIGCGQQVSGNRFGSWLRLTSWPDGSPIRTDDEIQAWWAPIRVNANPLRTRHLTTYMVPLGATTDAETEQS